MGVIKNIETIYEWTNKELNHTCGLYRVTLKSSDITYIFIKNADSVGVISHCVGRPANECVDIIRNDVRQEFLDLIREAEGR